MKKILFVCTDHHFPNGAFDFLISLHQTEKVAVTGLFFSPMEYGPVATASQIPIDSPYRQLKEKDRKVVEDNKALFVRQCSLNNIPYQIHANEEQWEKDTLGKESRFSDLVLLSGELFYPEMSTGQPNSFLHEALQVSESPVLIIPEHFAPLQRLVFAYDGGKESLHAMKQFCYLFPQYTDLPTEIVFVKDDDKEEIPDLDNLRGYGRLHFNSMGFSKLHFKHADAFAGWIEEKQQVLMVSGSFGRSSFSYLTRHSFAGKLIHNHKVPVFIAHS